MSLSTTPWSHFAPSHFHDNAATLIRAPRGGTHTFVSSGRYTLPRKVIDHTARVASRYPRTLIGPATGALVDPFLSTGAIRKAFFSIMKASASIGEQQHICYIYGGPLLQRSSLKTKKELRNSILPLHQGLLHTGKGLYIRACVFVLSRREDAGRCSVYMYVLLKRDS